MRVIWTLLTTWAISYQVSNGSSTLYKRGIDKLGVRKRERERKREYEREYERERETERENEREEE